MTRTERKNFFRGLTFTSLWIIGLGTFTAYPVIASLYYSFCDYSILKEPVWSGLENYRQLVHDDLFWKSLGNTLYYAALSVPIGTIVSLALALLLNQPVRGRSVFRVIFYLPSIVPLIAATMLWTWMLNGQYGLINAMLGPLLRPFGLTPPVWVYDPAWTKPALVLMSLWGTGNAMVIYLAGLQNVPKELYEAAEIDGAGEWTKFWIITMSLSKPILAVLALAAFTEAYGEFMMALVKIPDPRMWTLMVWLFQMQQFSHPSVVYASLVIAAVPTMLIFLLCQNLIIRGLVVPTEK